jgi:hypothetical protein
MAETEKIAFVTAWEPPTHVMVALAERLSSDAELNFRWELGQGNGAEYLIADNMVHDVDFWQAPAFEYPLDSLDFIMKCYSAGGQGGRFVDGQWYYETDPQGGSAKGYRTALEALVDANLEPGALDTEIEGIVEDFWESHSPQIGIQTLDHIENTRPDLSEEFRNAIQKVRATAPTQEPAAGPRA